VKPLVIVLTAIAGAAVAVPAWVVSHPPAIPRPAPILAKMPQSVRVVPPAEVPPVEPVSFVDLPPDDARAFNQTIPFVAGPNPAARPFRFVGGADELARATDCLATAVLYEAGDDATGERAVAQVVLNRLRHPAFPKTVCGVVFEGQDRATGCQFSFTCDGALTRWTPSEAGWKRAREIATLALSGAVFRPVGYATHYHTDWVVPYWQSSLDKLARVGTHLFFRWTGWWGTPPAFDRARTGIEPAIPKLAALSEAHRTTAVTEEAATALATAAAITGSGPIPIDGDSFLATLPAGVPAEGWPATALAACGDRPVCRYSAWKDRARTPAMLPLDPDQVASMSFSYIRDRAARLERTLWNCAEVKRPAGQCMKRQVLLTVMPVAAATPVPPPPPATKGPGELEGVRRAARPTLVEPKPPSQTVMPAKAGIHVSTDQR
jgi:hypothetical protein